LEDAGWTSRETTNRSRLGMTFSSRGFFASMWPGSLVLRMCQTPGIGVLWAMSPPIDREFSRLRRSSVPRHWY
jgi:hypothetical protein